MMDVWYVNRFEEKLKKKGHGIYGRRSAYSNIFTGEAKEAHFCWSKLGWGGSACCQPVLFSRR